MNHKNILKNLFYIVILVAVCSNLYAGPRNKYGLSSARELLIPVGSVGTALDGSNISNISGVDAIYWNPAGLASLDKNSEILFSNQRYIADIGINYFAGSYKLRNLGIIGLSVQSMSFGDIEVTTVDNPDGTGLFYSPTYLVAGLSFARAMTDKVNFGMTAKMIYNRIDRVSATGFAFSFGLQYKTEKGITFGVTLKNIGPNMSYEGQGLETFYSLPGTPEGTLTQPRMIKLASYELPTSLSIGLGYEYGYKKHNFRVNGTFQNNTFSMDDYNVGLEYNFNKLIYLRGGYNVNTLVDKNYQDEQIWGPSFGAGLRYNTGNISVGFDYAYKIADKFKDTQYFTLSLGF